MLNSNWTYQSTRKKNKKHTNCVFRHDSDSCIPKISPNSIVILEWLRKMYSIFLISEKNERAKLHFRR